MCAWYFSHLYFGDKPSQVIWLLSALIPRSISHYCLRPFKPYWMLMLNLSIDPVWCCNNVNRLKFMLKPQVIGQPILVTAFLVRKPLRLADFFHFATYISLNWISALSLHYVPAGHHQLRIGWAHGAQDHNFTAFSSVDRGAVVFSLFHRYTIQFQFQSASHKSHRHRVYLPWFCCLIGCQSHAGTHREDAGLSMDGSQHKTVRMQPTTRSTYANDASFFFSLLIRWCWLCSSVLVAVFRLLF